MAFAASIRVTGELYEDRAKIWPGKPGNPDQYPWRFETEPELVLTRTSGSPRRRSWATRAHRQVAARALEARVPGADPRRLRARREAAAATAARRAPPAHERAAGARSRACGALARADARRAARRDRGGRAVLSMFLPWYACTGSVDDSVSAFGVFSFVEAAVLLVALAVLALLFARAEGRDLPPAGRRRPVVMGAGRVGRAAARVAAVRQARREPTRSSASSGGSSSRSRPPGCWRTPASRMRRAQRPAAPLVRRRPRPPTRRPAPAAATGHDRHAGARARAAGGARRGRPPRGPADDPAAAARRVG